MNKGMRIAELVLSILTFAVFSAIGILEFVHHVASGTWPFPRSWSMFWETCVMLSVLMALLSISHLYDPSKKKNAALFVCGIIAMVIAVVPLIIGILRGGSLGELAPFTLPCVLFVLATVSFVGVYFCGNGYDSECTIDL